MLGVVSKRFFFLKNKGPLAAALEKAFTNLTLKSMPSLQEYCQKLQEIAAQLADVDQPVFESRLNIQLVSGLPLEYNVIATQLHHSLPSWEDATNLLDAEERRQLVRQQLAPVIAAIVPDTTNPPERNPTGRDSSRGPARYN
ncbi:hypothetical protein HanRHA438_Chr15g0697901 [Helianthus annuus]|nr:hypothetical protein HanRHA438_Chr15g0697901 [Helianthus annuus]